MFLHLKEIQHHDGDGHKNGMRGFHLKVYSESGVPELEVVSAEVGSYSHSMLYLPIACILGMERWCQSSSWRRIRGL